MITETIGCRSLQPETWEDARVLITAQNRTSPNLTVCGNQTFQQEQTFKLPASEKTGQHRGEPLYLVPRSILR